MHSTHMRKSLLATAGVAAVAVTLAGCSGSAANANAGGKVAISYLTQNDAASTAQGKALIAAFEKKNPDITVKMDANPGGTQGDNLIKTKLSTGTMDDVFRYVGGSLFQALNPTTTMVDQTAQSWVGTLDKDFKGVVSAGGKVYGAPLGTASAGGVLYNKKVYAKLGLSVPTTWAQFISNCEKIKASAPGVTPILESYAETSTSQYLVLSDFANLAKQDPSWAENYTNNKADAKYVNQPALASFEHVAQIREKGLVNKDFASMTYMQAMDALATGKGVHYPMQTAAIPTIQQNNPNNVNDIGVFATPTTNGSTSSITMWPANALYIAKTATGDKLKAAEKFVAFVNSPEGCDVQNKTGSPAGPYSTSACTLPSNVPALIADVQKYITDGASGPALEFISPIKGPNLESILIAVGSGITSAKDGAAQYDQDVKKQAQQLGLQGW